jgi:hypothetical protein
MTFTFKGCTNHEMVYEISGSDDAANLDGPTMLANLIADGMDSSTPISRCVSQVAPDQTTAQKLVLGVGLDGEHTVKPNLIGEASIQGRNGLARWDMQVDDDTANGIRIAASCVGTGTANLRIRAKHTIDR